MASAAYENSRNLLNEPRAAPAPYKESKIHDGFPVTEETAKYLALHRLLMVNPNDDPIELAPSRYETWRERFAEERDRIYDSLATDGLDRNIEHVEHVGSTAIPDLAAKDIVDIDVIVADDLGLAILPYAR